MEAAARKLRILVVDPDPLFRELVLHAFEAGGYGVQAAGTLAEARRRVARSAFDLAIVDRFLEPSGGRSPREVLQSASPSPLPVIGLWPGRGEGESATSPAAKDFDLRPLVAYVDWLFGRGDGDRPPPAAAAGSIGFERRPSRAYEVFKRGLDIVVAATALVLLAPLWVIIAAAIKLTSPGPVLFRQQRVGQGGRLFDCTKFRTMVPDADALKKALLQENRHGERGVTFKMKRDPRVTAVGRWLRRFSLDELPQLWNVLNGTMTLVGPRPPLPEEVARYTLLDRHRLAVKPGLTCLWQIGGRAEIDFVGQVNLDIEYIRKRSLKDDLVILLKTLPAVVSGRGAY